MPEVCTPLPFPAVMVTKLEKAARAKGQRQFSFGRPAQAADQAGGAGPSAGPAQEAPDDAPCICNIYIINPISNPI